MSDSFVEVDFGPSGAPARFDAPVERVVAFEPDEAARALARLDAARADGLWVAGYASYELGYLFEPRLVPLFPKDRRLPLLNFGLFRDGPAQAHSIPPGGSLSPLRPRWSQDEYTAAFARIAEYIRAGDIYQANLTFPLDGAWQGNPAALAAQLAARQPVGFGALVSLGDTVILSRSPELFFALDGLGGIEARPMKGTAPRVQDPGLDRKSAEALASDPKNRAENLMIVDLLRNDIGRIAEVGSVRVPALFDVETYATLRQMVSRVTGRLREDMGIGQILAALFPCGSVTGAPKLRAMEIIRELEPWPRDAYCGAIGWAAPDGPAQFNVAIRTLMLFPDGSAVLNVGGGIVADSTAPLEYEEALWKARFAAPSPATCC